MNPNKKPSSVKPHMNTAKDYAVKPTSVSSSWHEDGDLFKCVAKVRTLSGDTLRMQIVDLSAEFNIPVDVDISSLITNICEGNPGKMLSSNVAGSNKKYYPCLLAVNKSKNFVMRIQCNPVNRPYGLSIAFVDADVIKLILDQIKGINQSKLTAKGYEGEGEGEGDDKPPTFTGPSLAAQIQTNPAPVLPVHIIVKTQIVNSTIVLATKIRHLLECLHEGVAMDVQQDAMNQAYVAANHLVNKLTEHNLFLSDRDNIKSFAYFVSDNFNAFVGNKIEPILSRAQTALVSAEHVASQYSAYITPDVNDILIQHIKTFTWVNMLDASLSLYQHHHDTGSSAHLAAASQAHQYATKIASHIDVTPAYAHELKADLLTENPINPDYAKYLSGKVKSTLHQFHSANGKLILMVGKEVAQALSVVALLELAIGIQSPDCADHLIKEAITAHNKIILGLPDVVPALMKLLGGSSPLSIYVNNGSALDVKNAYLNLARDLVYKHIFRPIGPTYTGNVLLEHEEETLAKIGLLMLYGMHSAPETMKGYAQYIITLIRPLLLAIKEDGKPVSYGYHLSLMRAISACLTVPKHSLQMTGKAEMLAGISPGEMDVKITLSSIQFESTFGVIVADMAFLYLTATRHLPVGAATLQKIAIQAKSLSNHPLKHIFLSYATRLLGIAKYINEQEKGALITDVQDKIADTADNALQMILASL